MILPLALLTEWKTVLRNLRSRLFIQGEYHFSLVTRSRSMYGVFISVCMFFAQCITITVFSINNHSQQSSLPANSRMWNYLFTSLRLRESKGNNAARR